MFFKNSFQIELDLLKTKISTFDQRLTNVEMEISKFQSQLISLRGFVNRRLEQPQENPDEEKEKKEKSKKLQFPYY